MRARDALTAGFGIAAAAVSIFAVGGAHRWSQAIIAALIGLALLPQSVSRRMSERISPLTALLGMAAALCAIQLIPLPAGLLDQLSPTGSGLRQDGAELVGASPWQALTFDAPGTLRALCSFLILLGAAFVALRIALTEKGRYRLLATVGALTGAVVLVVGAHELVGAQRLYGLYEPQHATPSVLGPLLNENHLGCLMAIGTVINFGLVFYRRQPSWLRVTWLVAASLCAATTVLSLSRGATLALLVGFVVTGGAMIGQRFAPVDVHRKRRSRFMTSSLPIGVVAACTIIVIVYASAGGISRELSRTTLQEISQPKSKYAAWRSAAELVQEAPWTGIGRGAFESAFSRVHDASAFATFSHVENEYIQAVVDWGIPGALALGILGVWLTVTALRRWRDGPLVAAALGALTVVALQSNVDFGIEILGIALPMTLVIATIAYVPVREPKAGAVLALRAARVTHIVALGAVVLILLAPMTQSMAEDHEAIQGIDRPTLDQVRPMIERHPLDYYGYARAAQTMARDGNALGIRLLNHALTLHPTHSGLHRLAARLLLRTGRSDQAALEYVLALRGTLDVAPMLREIVTSFPTAESAASAIPVDAHPPKDILQVLQDLKRHDVASAWLLRVLEARPNNLRICEMVFEIAIQRVDLGVFERTGARCSDFEPGVQSILQLSHGLYNKKRYVETIRLLKDTESWPGRIDMKVNAWLTLCDSHFALGAWNEAKRCVRRLDVSGYITADLRPQITRRLDQIEIALKKAMADEAAALKLTEAEKKTGKSPGTSALTPVPALTPGTPVPVKPAVTPVPAVTPGMGKPAIAPGKPAVTPAKPAPKPVTSGKPAVTTVTPTEPVTPATGSASPTP